MNKQEAEQKALEARPTMRIVSVTEKEKCFVVNMVPKKYPYDIQNYIGGSTRVDKKTGKIRLYNPMIEEYR